MKANPHAEPAAALPFEPIQPDERLPVLDVLRGFALLGILMVNTPGFNQPWALWPSGERWFPGPLDRAVEWFTNFFFTGKFNSIFSFLFGVGLTIQLERAATRHTNFVPVYLRRLGVLFLFGAVHSVFIWIGDVLHIYAVLGLLLLLLRRVRDKWTWSLMAVLLLAPVARECYKLYTHEKPKHDAAYYQTLAHEQLRIYQRGTASEMTRERLREMRVGYTGEEEGLYWFYASMGVTILLGFIAGRRRIFQDLALHLWWMRKLMWWCLSSGLLLAVGFATCAEFAERTPEPTMLGCLTSVFYQLNRPLVCVFYLCAITLLFQKAAWRRWFMPLSFVGRMPLTNYLMQSVICVLIFNSYGLGLFGKVGPAAGLLLVVAIFALQVFFSNWWFGHFPFGPLERLWRLATYGPVSALRSGTT